MKAWSDKVWLLRVFAVTTRLSIFSLLSVLSNFFAIKFVVSECPSKHSACLLTSQYASLSTQGKIAWNMSVKIFPRAKYISEGASSFGHYLDWFKTWSILHWFRVHRFKPHQSHIQPPPPTTSKAFLFLFSQGFYYFALVSDLFLRLSWILTVSVGEAGLFHSEVLTALLAVLEVFR